MICVYFAHFYFISVVYIIAKFLVQILFLSEVDRVSEWLLIYYNKIFKTIIVLKVINTDKAVVMIEWYGYRFYFN